MNSTKIGSSQKFQPLISGTPKNGTKVEESQTQKKGGTTKMSNDLINIEGV